MEKEEWISRIEKAASVSDFMSLEDKDYTPSGREKGFVIGDYTLVVKKPSAMVQYSQLTGPYNSFCCGRVNMLSQLEKDISGMVRYKESDHENEIDDIFSELEYSLLNYVDERFKILMGDSMSGHSEIPGTMRIQFYKELRKAYQRDIVENRNRLMFMNDLDTIVIKRFFEVYAEILRAEKVIEIYSAKELNQKIQREINLSYFLNNLDAFTEREQQKKFLLLAMCIDPFYQGYKLFEEYALRFHDVDRKVYEALHCINPEASLNWDKNFQDRAEARYIDEKKLNLNSISESNIKDLKQKEANIMSELKLYGIASPIPDSTTAKIHDKLERYGNFEYVSKAVIDKLGDKLEQAVDYKQRRDFENRRGEKYENSKQGKKDKKNAEILAEEFAKVDLFDQEGLNAFEDRIEEVSPYNKDDYHQMVNSFVNVQSKDIEALRRYSKYSRMGLASRIILGFVISFAAWIALTVLLCMIRDIPKLITFEQWRSISDAGAYIALIAALVNMMANAIYASKVGKRWKIATLNGKLIHPSIAYIPKSRK